VSDIKWYSYEWERPQQDLPVIMRRRNYGSDETLWEMIMISEELPDWFNVSGLEWRPTGIFTEFGGTITRNHQGWQQANCVGLGSSSFMSALLGSAASQGIGEWL